MKYCSRCVMPTTKPDLFFDGQGVCIACRNYEKRKEVDWSVKKKELIEVLNRYAGKGEYDCIVPVSGGKDSTFQTIQMLNLGAKPLCVTATTDHLTDIGRKNIENVKRLGVDYVEVSTNPVVRRRINKFTLEEVGDISWPEHVTIFTIPVRMAVAFKIPLLIWGENSQSEYGGPAAAADRNVLTREWLEEFGGLLGLRVSDLLGCGFKENELRQYSYPSDEELSTVGVSGLFLGHYLPWDGWKNAVLAYSHGFSTYDGQPPGMIWANPGIEKPVEGSCVNYENLDNAQTGIHDYFKYLKLGFGRATDLVCMWIRRERISREEGIKIVQEFDGRFPWSYLGYKLEDILEPIGIHNITEFKKICDKFTNRVLFETGKDGKFVRWPDGSPKLKNAIS